MRGEDGCLNFMYPKYYLPLVCDAFQRRYPVRFSDSGKWLDVYCIAYNQEKNLFSVILSGMVIDIDNSDNLHPEAWRTAKAMKSREIDIADKGR